MTHLHHTQVSKLAIVGLDNAHNLHGRGLLNMVSAITCAYADDALTMLDLPSYYKLAKGTKGEIIEGLFFQVFDLEGKAGSKNPEGYQSHHRKALDAILHIAVLLASRKEVIITTSEGNHLAPKWLTIGDLSFNDDSLVSCDSLQAMRKPATVKLTKQMLGDDTSISSTVDKNSTNEESEKINLSFNEDGEYQGTSQDVIALLNTTIAVIESLTKDDMTKELTEALTQLQYDTNHALKLANAKAA